MSRPKHYPYSRSMWEEEITEFYSEGCLVYRTVKDCNRITGEERYK